MAWSIKQGDTRPILVLTLKENGVAKNLTGADSARALFRSGATIVQPTTVITNAAAGEVSVTFSAANTATSGEYDGEVEITWDPGQIETYPNDGYFQISIKDDIA